MCRLHHIGILVRDIPPDAIEDKEQQAFVKLLDSQIEIVAPNGENSHLANKQCGLHHLCYEVPSIECMSDVMRTLGMFPISVAKPAKVFDGRCVTWFMNEDGLLIELLEEKLC
jgi:catechol 2,3-dioxygenase-like lactoylglutathione lyase family enzyme